MAPSYIAGAPKTIGEAMTSGASNAAKTLAADPSRPLHCSIFRFNLGDTGA
jgi:hypothetical protein